MTAVAESMATCVEEAAETAVAESMATSVEEAAETAVAEAMATSVEEAAETAVAEATETALVRVQLNFQDSEQKGKVIRKLPLCREGFLFLPCNN